ncbi:MAG: carbohydrate porin, partial [Nitrospinota bacterium]
MVSVSAASSRTTLWSLSRVAPASIAVAAVFVCVALFYSNAHARSLFDRDGALDVVRDAKPYFDNRGVDLEIVYTGEIFGIVAGGEKKTDNVVYLSDPGFNVLPTKYLDNLDIKLTIDTGKAGLWDRGKIFIYGLANSGADPSEYVGDKQGTSNIEANDSSRLFELWYEHTYYNGGMSVLVGLHDLNSEFYVTEYGGLFLNSSFRIGPEMSRNLPLPIFNVTALGARLKLKPSRTLTYLAAVYDGDPGSPRENYDGLRVRVNENEEGFLFIGEAQMGYTGEEPGFLPNSVRFGAWYHSGQFQSVDVKAGLASSGTGKGNAGVYATADRSLVNRRNGRELGVFFQAGFTMPSVQDRNEVFLYLGGGVNYPSLFDSRPKDIFGIAVAYAKVSDDYASAKQAASGLRLTGETVIELTYRAIIYPWFTLQPDYQVVLN